MQSCLRCGIWLWIYHNTATQRSCDYNYFFDDISSHYDGAYLQLLCDAAESKSLKVSEQHVMPLLWKIHTSVDGSMATLMKCLQYVVRAVLQ
jgi:hypothetical protein